MDAAARAGPPPLDDEAYEGIARLVYEHTGIRLGPSREYFVTGRLAGLLRELGCARWSELPRRVREGPREVREALIHAVVTPETRFFRDGAPFRALRRDVVPGLLGRGRGRVRIWSAGCSTGQEPYSIVMALWDLVEAGDLDLDVVATDISAAALSRAREGVFEPWELRRGLDAAALARYFEPAGRGRARVRPAIRQRVRFERRNLVDDPAPEGRFHVTFYRNVGIYFDRRAREAVYRKILRALVPRGFLFLGGTETLFPAVPGFEPLYFGRALAYRRTGEGPS